MFIDFKPKSTFLKFFTICIPCKSNHTVHIKRRIYLLKRHSNNLELYGNASANRSNGISKATMHKADGLRRLIK